MNEQEEVPREGDLIAEGKTKEVLAIVGDDDNLILRNKDTITAFDDPSKTVILEGKGAWCTAVNTAVCEMLKRHGIPVAFIRQLSSTSTLVRKCKMIPLEIIMRNFPYGSFLLRFPELADSETFPNSFFELFLKTTKGKLEYNGELILEGLDPLAGEEDPWIPEPTALQWHLRHPKKPLSDLKGDLDRVIDPNKILGPVRIWQVENLARNINLALKSAWAKLQYRLIDIKFEFGITADGELVLADVIDPDSWRLEDPDKVDFSKQSFRNGAALEEVASKYQRVVSLVQNFVRF